MSEGKLYRIDVTRTLTCYEDGTVEVWAESEEAALSKARDEDIVWGDEHHDEPDKDEVDWVTADVEELSGARAYGDCDEDCASCGYTADECDHRGEGYTCFDCDEEFDHDEMYEDGAGDHYCRECWKESTSKSGFIHGPHGAAEDDYALGTCPLCSTNDVETANFGHGWLYCRHCGVWFDPETGETTTDGAGMAARLEPEASEREDDAPETDGAERRCKHCNDPFRNSPSYRESTEHPGYCNYCASHDFAEEAEKAEHETPSPEAKPADWQDLWKRAYS